VCDVDFCAWCRWDCRSENDWVRCWISWKECKECGERTKWTSARPQACKEWTGGGQRASFKGGRRGSVECDGGEAETELESLKAARGARALVERTGTLAMCPLPIHTAPAPQGYRLAANKGLRALPGLVGLPCLPDMSHAPSRHSPDANRGRWSDGARRCTTADGQRAGSASPPARHSCLASPLLSRRGVGPSRRPGSPGARLCGSRKLSCHICVHPSQTRQR